MNLQIPNPLTINDWKHADFLKVILGLQVGLWGLIVLDSTVLPVPMPRAFFAFIYLLLVPGITLLRVLRLHKLGSVETLLYTVGLSAAIIMVAGLLLNVIGPAVGIMAPLSLIPVISVLSLIEILLAALSYIRDRDFCATGMLSLKEVTPSVLFFLLVPFLSIFGAFAMNAYQNNILLISLLLLIASLIVIAVHYKKDLAKAYPLIVFSISLALLFHRSLISPYTTGWDIQVEHYFASLVVQNSYWNASLLERYDAMLSIVMLAPIASIVSNVDLTWIFKTLFPLVYSLVPVGLYMLCKKQMESAAAFLSVMFFVSITSFYSDMPMLAKQQIAELFLILILLLIVDSSMERTKRSVLLLTFCFGLITSHYAVSYIFVLALVAVFAGRSIFELITRLRRQSPFAKRRRKARTSKSSQPHAGTAATFTLPLLCVFVIGLLAWYTYVAGASSLSTFLNTFGFVAESVSNELFNPVSSQGAAILLNTPSSPLHAVNKDLYLIAIFFVVVGFAATVLKYDNSRLRLRLNKELFALDVPIFALLMAGVALSYVAQSLQTSRLLHICLIFLTPFIVIGVLALSEVTGRIVKTRLLAHDKVLCYVSVFLAIFLLFDSGVVFQVAHDSPTSQVLNSSLDGPFFNNMELEGAKWIENYAPYNKSMYADEYRLPLLESMRLDGLKEYPADPTVLAKTAAGSYMYLGTTNVQHNTLRVIVSYSAVQASAYYNATLATGNRSLIYTDGGSKIYLS